MEEVRQHEPKCRLYVTQTKVDLLTEPPEAESKMDARGGTAGVLENMNSDRLASMSSPHIHMVLFQKEHKHSPPPCRDNADLYPCCRQQRLDAGATQRGGPRRLQHWSAVSERGLKG